MLSPVHRGWQGLLRRLGIGLGQHPWVGSLHPAQVESPELLPGEVGELGHPGAVAGLGLGQLQLLQVGGEDLEAGLLLVGGGVGLVELHLELPELLPDLLALHKSNKKREKKNCSHPAKILQGSDWTARWGDKS